MSNPNPMMWLLLFLAVAGGGLAAVSVWAMRRTRDEVPDTRDRKPLLALMILSVLVAAGGVWIITKIPELLSRAVY